MATTPLEPAAPTPPTPLTLPARRRVSAYVWASAGLAFVAAVVCSSLAIAFGIELKLGARDVTLAGALLFELAFGTFGFLVGRAAEAARWERRAARDAREQMEQLVSLQARLAQSEKLALLGQIAGSIAHEVRNPLAIVRSMVQNLAEDDDSGAIRETCRHVIDEIDRLSRVTGSLLALARPLPLRRAPVPAADVARRIEPLARCLAAAHGQRFHADGPVRADLRIEADADLLGQVLLGLVANAAAVTPTGGELRLDWGRAGTQVEFGVSDQGPGVAPELRERVFEPFFTTRAEGSGLGLAVARQIVAAHGGSIAVEDAHPCGARFAVRLPAAATVTG